MELERLVKCIDLGYSHKKISLEFNISQSTVRYWLKKYNLKTNNNRYNKNTIRDNKYCPKCNEYKSISEFYMRSDRDNVTGYCKKCSTEYHRNRLAKVKIKMIQYKDGECSKCTLKLKDSHYSVFDFHHLDPNEKDVNFKGIKHKKWEIIKKEIDKCVLLCANCHRLEHAKFGPVV